MTLGYKIREMGGRRAFSRWDLLLSLATIGLLLVSGLAMVPRETAKRSACSNNLRQLGVALLSYADEHEDTFPPRRLPAWPTQLQPYYKEGRTLLCPADGPNPASAFTGGTNADSLPRSYIINGWTDYFAANMLNPNAPIPMPVAGIPEPGQTIVFGEKYTYSMHLFLDYPSYYDDFTELEQGRHMGGGEWGKGESNYAFVDGSVRSLPYGRSIQPVLLWATEPEVRTNSYVVVE